MAYQTWIADKIREYGVDVVEVAGWQTRGRPDGFEPQGVVAHHTASRQGHDAPALRIVTHGRSDLPGPLSQILLSRSGRAYIVAAGKANHAGRGGALGLNSNYQVFGIEAENDGVVEAWSPQQMEAYLLVTAALLDGIGKTGSHVVGHKEWAPGRKIDPNGINMDHFRAQVNGVLETGPRGSVEPQKPEQNEGSKWKPEAGPTLEKGEHGPFVKDWQEKLAKHAGQNVKADGYFGEATEKATKNFQSFFGLKVDGVVGEQTGGLMNYIIASLNAPKGRPTLRQGDTGEHVAYLQGKLGALTVDGIFGNKTYHRVRKFQRAKGLVVDGIVGPQTWAAVG